MLWSYEYSQHRGSDFWKTGLFNPNPEVPCVLLVSGVSHDHLIPPSEMSRGVSFNFFQFWLGNLHSTNFSAIIAAAVESTEKVLLPYYQETSKLQQKVLLEITCNPIIIGVARGRIHKKFPMFQRAQYWLFGITMLLPFSWELNQLPRFNTKFFFNVPWKSSEFCFHGFHWHLTLLWVMD